MNSRSPFTFDRDHSSAPEAQLQVELNPQFFKQKKRQKFLFSIHPKPRGGKSPSPSPLPMVSRRPPVMGPRDLRRPNLAHRPNAGSEVLANLENLFLIRKSTSRPDEALSFSRTLGLKLSEMKLASTRSSRCIIQTIQDRSREITRMVLPVRRLARTRLWGKLKSFVLYLKRKGFDAKRVMRLPGTPTFHPDSSLFIEACKADNSEFVGRKLSENFYLSFEFDPMRYSGLHWAAKKGANSVAKILIDSGTYLDSTDFMGRPPLYYFLRNNNLPLALHMLKKGASPWSPEGCNLLEACKDFPELTLLVRKFRFANLSTKLFGGKRREKHPLDI